MSGGDDLILQVWWSTPNDRVTGDQIEALLEHDMSLDAIEECAIHPGHLFSDHFTEEQWRSISHDQR